MSAVTAQRIYEAALHYLQRYSSSSENLRRVLQRRMKRRQMRFHDVPDEAMGWVDQAVERCLKNNLVNDALYTEGRIVSLRRQGRSKNFIVQSLTQKGVPKKIILQFLPDDEEDDLAAARKLVKKKRLGKKIEREDQQKDLAKVLRAGFSMSVARKALQTSEEFDESYE